MPDDSEYISSFCVTTAKIDLGTLDRAWLILFISLFWYNRAIHILVFSNSVVTLRVPVVSQFFSFPRIQLGFINFHKKTHQDSIANFNYQTTSHEVHVPVKQKG